MKNTEVISEEHSDKGNRFKYKSQQSKIISEQSEKSEERQSFNERRYKNKSTSPVEQVVEEVQTVKPQMDDKETQYPEIRPEQKVINNIFIPHNIKHIDDQIMVAYRQVQLDRFEPQSDKEDIIKSVTNEIDKIRKANSDKLGQDESMNQIK